MAEVRRGGASAGSNVGEALARATCLLGSDPQAALSEARRILRLLPTHRQARIVEGEALRRMGTAQSRPGGSVPGRPATPETVWQAALTASEGGGVRAISALQSLLSRHPEHPRVWFLLAGALRSAGRTGEAWHADLSGVQASSRDSRLLEAAVAMREGRFEDGRSILDDRLRQVPDDPVATRLLGEISWRQGEMTEALALVSRAVELAPGFDLAREFLIRLLMQNNRLTEALDEAGVLCASPVKNPGHELLKASILVRLGDQNGAGAIYERLLALRPDQPQVWQNQGHVLKTLGRQAEAVHAYRQAVRYQPKMGEAWWSLANLKTVRLDGDDIKAMLSALMVLEQEKEEKKEDIFHICFSLGKAYEDTKDYKSSFAYYDRGNRLRREMVRYDADDFSTEIAATTLTFTRPLIIDRGDGGCPARDPILIVGLPRSGSTLVEQILASHSQVEGTMELPEMMIIASRLQSRVDDGEFPDFPTMIASLTHADRIRLGEEYIDNTRAYRETDRPFFVDKMPNNWQHIGLVRLILPNASIVDARRHPVACCFSGWKQHFARGQVFSYDMVEIGRYYRDYVSLMAGVDAAMPGHVHRVIYERMVADTRGEVSRLLDYLRLPYEDDCLAFWRNARSVRTASSEQVRTPIFADAVDHWRHFKADLAPLIDTLGSLVGDYPEAHL